MHLKNFSLMHTNNGILFSPAYDLLNVNLVFPEDKENPALTLNGRKRKIKRTDFDQLSISLDITAIVRNHIYVDFTKQIENVKVLIDSSFLTNEYKENYTMIVQNKMKQIEL